jgi:hypothetical protein
MRVHVGWDRNEVVGGAALGLDQSHLFAMANRETDLYTPLVRSPTDLDPVLQPVATGPWTRITLPALPIGEPVTESLVAMLRSEGWLIHETFRESCPIIDTSGAFEDYWGGLSSKARSNLRRGRKRLEGEGRLEIRLMETVDKLEPALSEAFALEAAGWKGHAKSATLSSERATRFWRSVSEGFHRAGVLRFSELRLDRSLIAFSLAVLHGGRIYRMKTSYDERYSRFSPGNVLLMEMVGRAFDEAIDAVEMLGPMLDSKQRFATEARETMILRAYRRRPLGAVRYAGRRRLVPLLRPAYVRYRQELDRIRGRRHAAPAVPRRSR